MRDAIIALSTVLLIIFAVDTANGSSCDAMPDLTAARLRWSKTRAAETPRLDQICRIYRTQFYEAVVARQAVVVCKAGAEQQREIQMLDAEIDSINELIASQCSAFDSASPSDRRDRRPLM